MANKRYLLIDGYNIVYRSFYAVPLLNNQTGVASNAIIGWIKTLWKLQDLYSPDYVLSFFDLGGAQRQLGLLESYKANRKDMPEALKIQIPLIKEITQALGIPVLQQEGVEADDLIASLAHQLSREGHLVYIVSADKDFAQIVEDNIRQIVPPSTVNPQSGWKVMTPECVQEKFGVSVAQIPDYLALIGDSADNVPGIVGVGPKTASQWLKEYGSIESILMNIQTVKPDRFRALLSQGEELLRRNLELITLHKNCLIPVIDEPKCDMDGLVRILGSLNMEKTLHEAKKRLRIEDKQCCFDF